MKKILEQRLNILAFIVLGIFVIFTLKLVQYQIIDGEMYYSKSNATTRINQTVTAARGDITDVNGVPLAGSQVVFDVTINKAYMPSDKLNQRLLEVVRILQAQGETLNDILILVSAPMFCCYWQGISLFLWACLFVSSFPKILGIQQKNK